ncbi:uncharacterized protein METZ01_LOCUS207586, partial [marine metagenome]
MARFALGFNTSVEYPSSNRFSTGYNINYPIWICSIQQP